MYQRIKDLREDGDFNQNVLAEYLSVRQQTYSRYETGQRVIPVDAISKLADFYKTSVDYLMGRTDVKEPYPKSRIKDLTS